MEPSSIPKQYGGELDWNWGDMPSFDEDARETTGGLEVPQEEGTSKKEFIKGPLVWHGDRTEILGTVDGKERRMEFPAPEKPAEGEKVIEKEGIEEEEKESSGDDATAVNGRVVPVFSENEKAGDATTTTVDANGAPVTPESEHKSAAALAA